MTHFQQKYSTARSKRKQKIKNTSIKKKPVYSRDKKKPTEETKRHFKKQVHQLFLNYYGKNFWRIHRNYVFMSCSIVLNHGFLSDFTSKISRARKRKYQSLKKKQQTYDWIQLMTSQSIIYKLHISKQFSAFKSLQKKSGLHKPIPISVAKPVTTAATRAL